MHAQLQFFRDVSWIMDPEYNHLNTILGIFGGENWSINLIRTHMRGTYVYPGSIFRGKGRVFRF